MSRILKVSESDYRIKVQSSGTITLDTGVDVGTVVVTGNLVVQGETTTVNTTNMTIEDNIILLNKGEENVGALPPPANGGITEDSAGIQIQRSLNSSSVYFPDAQILFDESVDHWNPRDGETQQGTFVLKSTADNSSSVTSGLRTAAIVAPGGSDLVFDMTGTEHVLKLVNTTDYSSRITDDNHIPNRRWVTDYVEAGTFVEGQADVDRYYNGTVDPGTGLVTINSMGVAKNDLNTPSLEFYIRDSGSSTPSLRAKIINTGLYVDDIRLFGNTIQTVPASGVSNNLILTAVTENVEVNAVLNLDDRAAGSSSVPGKTRIYSRSQLTPRVSSYPGNTGVFITNNVTSDELVAKNRALLFSMLF